MSIVLLVASGCGSSDSNDSTGVGPFEQDRESAAKLGGEIAHRAESICRSSREAIAELADDFRSRVATNAGSDAVTKALVIPGVKILNREAARLGRVEARPDTLGFETYVGLFDPIIELGEQRIEAGEAGEPERGHALELLIVTLEHEQGAIAQELGLKACGVSFIEALRGPQ